MHKIEMLCLFLLGGAAYLGVEIAWRGTTHWTMFLAGGVCLCYLNWLNLHWAGPLLLCAGVGAVGISGIELAFGLLCTKVLHLHVWDYSAEWGNVAGLICPKYTALWFLLCWWVLFVLRWLRVLLA